MGRINGDLCRPFRAWRLSIPYPGRCPGLAWNAPSGRRTKGSRTPAFSCNFGISPTPSAFLPHLRHFSHTFARSRIPRALPWASLECPFGAPNERKPHSCVLMQLRHFSHTFARSRTPSAVFAYPGRCTGLAWNAPSGRRTKGSRTPAFSCTFGISPTPSPAPVCFWARYRTGKDRPTWTNGRRHARFPGSERPIWATIASIVLRSDRGGPGSWGRTGTATM
jgi:hypothetical protein